MNPYESPTGLAEGKWYLDPIAILQTLLVFTGLSILCFLLYPVLVVLDWKRQTQVKKIFESVMVIVWFLELAYVIIILLGQQHAVAEFIEKWVSKIYI